MRKILFLLFILITVFSSSLFAQSYEAQYKKCSEILKGLSLPVDSIYFVRVHQRDSCLAGSIAPDFNVTSVKGENIQLSKLKGQVVVLNFWFTRCGPCIEEMPALNQLVKFYSGKKVKFISFAPEDSLSLEKFFQQHPFNFTAIPNSEDIRRNIFKLFSAWPYAIIIDKEGRISKMWFGNTGENIFEFYKENIDKLL